MSIWQYELSRHQGLTNNSGVVAATAAAAATTSQLSSNVAAFRSAANIYANEPASAGSCPADYQESLLSQMAGIRSNADDHGVSQQHPWLFSPRIVAAHSNHQQQYRIDQLQRELQTMPQMDFLQSYSPRTSQSLIAATRALVADDDDGSKIQYDDIRFVNEFASKFPTIAANVSLSCTWW
jgi:hypothetical protein